MSRRELAKIAKEIKSIKAQLEPWYKNPGPYKDEIEKELKDLAKEFKADGPWLSGHVRSEVKDNIGGYSAKVGDWHLQLDLEYGDRPVLYLEDDEETSGKKYTGDLSRDFKNIESWLEFILGWVKL